MKKILLPLGLVALASTASAQYYIPGNPDATYLIGGVSFEQLIINGYAATDTNDPYLIESVIGLYTDTNPAGDYSYVTASGDTFVPRVTVHWDGTNGSSDWNTESEFQSAGGIGGVRVETEVGEQINSTRRLPGGDRVTQQFDSQTGPLGNATLYDQASLGMTVQNGYTVSFVLDTTGYEFSGLQFAAGMVTGTAGSITWSYQVLGGGSGLIGTTNLTDVFNPFTFNFDGTFAGNEIVTILATVNGTAGNLIALDSVGFLGSAALAAIPEPSTYAAILGLFCTGMGIARRRRKAA